MSTYFLFSLFLLFVALFSVISATGHLRLELTSSNDFGLQLKTDSGFQQIFLTMGSTKTVSFHPKFYQETLEISFSKRGSTPQKCIYHLKTTDEPSYQTFVFSKYVLLVQSFFECDAGFHGASCQEKSTSSTSTTAKMTSTTTEVKTTTTAEVSTVFDVVTEGPAAKSLASERMISTNIFICSILIIVIVVLLILIAVVFVSLRPHQQHIHIGPQSRSPTKNKCQIVLKDSSFQSPESSRYTAAPHSFLTITL